MNKYTLYIREPNHWWLANSIKTFKRKYETLKEDRDFIDRALTEPVVQKVFKPFTYTDLQVKHIKVIRYLLELMECKAVWVTQLTPDGMSTYITIEIFGFKEDVRLVENYLNYFINGSIKASINIQKELRRLKINARRKKQYLSYNSVTKATELIGSYLIELETELSNLPSINSLDKNMKLDLIFQYIVNRKKLDVKRYKNLTKETIKSTTSKKGGIQLNRLV